MTGSSGYFSGYRMPESFKAFCRIVSLTAAKTKRIFDVSVAWVRLKGKEGRKKVSQESRCVGTGTVRIM